MTRPVFRWLVSLVLGISSVLLPPARVRGADITREQVLDSVQKAIRFLLKERNRSGVWRLSTGDPRSVGVTSLVVLALLNAGMSPHDPEVQPALAWLRNQNPENTYEISLMIQALAAAKVEGKDKAVVARLAHRLEELQIRGGPNDGLWNYGNKPGAGDRSNGQFAVLGLHDAQEMGVPISLDVWRRARVHWVGSQNPDGSWAYNGLAGTATGTGSMTAAGIATLVITEAMMRSATTELHPDGSPVCCAEDPPDRALEAALRWMGNHFAVSFNPGSPRRWSYYYLYGLERAGRFSGLRFFSNSRGDRHDWYREGAEYLVSRQNRIEGFWQGEGSGESDPVVGTSFALMFLAKGLSPVLINKLQYGPLPKSTSRDAPDWNRHRRDVANLTQLITTLDKWPRFLLWQTLDISQASIDDLQQAPIAFFTGTESPQFTSDEIGRLKEFVQQGGVLFVVNGCKSAAFDEGFRRMVRQMYPTSEGELKKLDASHPVFRAEYNLIDEKTGEPIVELWGVDLGCRTSIFYSPEDIACLWDKWTSFDMRPPPRLAAMVTKATRVGVNVVAYVTGREVFDKLQRRELIPSEIAPDRIERDLLKLAKLHYAGDWNAAPNALRNLLMALHRAGGLDASATQRDVAPADPNLLRYPIAYMHGRHSFALGLAEQQKLRQFIANGGVLFADACCGTREFDRSFRRLIEQLFPDKALKRIPVDHELFSKDMGYELKSVRRREPIDDADSAAASTAIRAGEPWLEGIEIDGRFVVIYSKYDISCALERSAPSTCIGYVHDDAVRIGMNIVRYLLQ